jgi:hypothetical protein
MRRVVLQVVVVYSSSPARIGSVFGETVNKSTNQTQRRSLPAPLTPNADEGKGSSEETKRTGREEPQAHFLK